jgi:hypothetical protein
MYQNYQDIRRCSVNRADIEINTILYFGTAVPSLNGYVNIAMGGPFPTSLYVIKKTCIHP